MAKSIQREVVEYFPVGRYVVEVENGYTYSGSIEWVPDARFTTLEDAKNYVEKEREDRQTFSYRIVHETTM